MNSNRKTDSAVQHDPEVDTLAALQPREHARIVSLECTGMTRRRFLDLGLVPGSEIAVIMKSYGGDPVAYRVKGTLLAIRRKDAEKIIVESITISESENL